MNFQITIPGKYSDLFINRGIYDFNMALEFMRNLKYERISESNNLSLVLQENRGTCSSKHALLASLAEEQNQTDINLVIGIYKMTKQNTPGIGNELALNNLTYLPEAHCYLKIRTDVIDITFKDSGFDLISKDILLEEIIKPDEVGTHKVRLHKMFLSRWIEENNIPLTLHEIWTIRERCILNLSEKKIIRHRSLSK